jgi:aminocarboxymuconate-semialdehyde decarboxylase
MTSHESAGSPVIDIHAHTTPQRFRAAIESDGSWHGLGPEFGELENPKNLLSPEERLQEMDRLGVDIQALSSTDCFYQYDNDPATTQAIARDANDELAEIHEQHPDRYLGLGTLPMQDVPAAVSELQRIMEELGLQGVMIDDHVRNKTYELDEFLPFWEAAEALGAVVFFHQYAPTVVTYRTTSWFLPNSIGNLVDRAITFGTLVFGGVMDRFPELKVCLGHAGGYASFGVDRMDKGWEAAALDYMPDEPRRRIQKAPSEYLGDFYYDSVTYKESTLRFLIDRVGIDQVVFGTDYPAPMVVADAVNWIRSLPSLTSEEKEAILCHNPARLLGMSQPSGD